jgi:hypothetical protein
MAIGLAQDSGFRVALDLYIELVSERELPETYETWLDSFQFFTELRMNRLKVEQVVVVDKCSICCTATPSENH